MSLSTFDIQRSTLNIFRSNFQTTGLRCILFYYTASPGTVVGMCYSDWKSEMLLKQYRTSVQSLKNSQRVNMPHAVDYDQLWQWCGMGSSLRICNSRRKLGLGDNQQWSTVYPTSVGIISDICVHQSFAQLRRITTALEPNLIPHGTNLNRHSTCRCHSLF